MTTPFQYTTKTTSRRFPGLLLILLVIAVTCSGAFASTPSTGAGNDAPAGMVFIPGGEFTFGSSPEDIDWNVQRFFSQAQWYQTETPGQKMAMQPFYIDKFEVTVAQYRKFMDDTHRPPPKYIEDAHYNRDDYPVVGVTWEDASAYCQWAGKKLPNEAQWEKAARGEDGRRYPWGNEDDPGRANVRGKKDGYRYVAPVGSFPDGQSPYGVMDMAGNVWEWMDNWYLPYPGNREDNDLYGQTLKVMRGGSWHANMDLARASSRGTSLPDQKHPSIGFRCVKPLSSK